VPSTRGSETTRRGVCALAAACLMAVAPAAAQNPGALATPAARRQDPQPPFPYEEVEAAIVSSADGTRLEGTLTLPRGESPFPAVLLLSGAGAQDRDYGALGHRFFLVLADHLTRQGIAVLRLDDRGAGRSAGDSGQATIADAAGDVQSGVAWLRQHPRVAVDRVGLLAHSEGGRVAPVAIGRTPGVAFLVLLAPPAMSADALAGSQAAAAGGDPTTRAQSALLLMIRRRVQEEPDLERAAAGILDGLDAWAGTLPPDEAGIVRAIATRAPFRAQLPQLVAAFGTPWNRSLFRLDPEPPLAALRVPVLALYGDLDKQAPPGDNAPILQRLWATHPDATVRVLPGLNHFLQHARTGLPAEIPGIDETMAPDALGAIADWVVKRFGGSR
jgi:pimeloyl-ACP methyl ester carboxylesterase